MQRSESYIALKIHDDDGFFSEDGDQAFSIRADNEHLKCLVKDRREDYLLSLGGIGGLTATLASSMEYGILGDGPDVRRRRKAFGVNTYPKRKAKSLASQFWDTLMKDVSLIVLLLGASLSLGFGVKEHGVKDGWYDGTSILVSVFLIVAVSVVGSHWQAKLFDKLGSKCDNNTTIIRGGQRQEVPISEVVVGDVVILKIGDIVPADGVLLWGDELEVQDPRRRTAEEDPTSVSIGSENPFCATGAIVTVGYGRIIITAVGTDTGSGELMSSIVTRKSTDPTPLQQRLEGLMSKTGRVRNAFAILIALYSTGSTSDVSCKLVGIFQHALSIVVVAIPEALPLALTLTLAFATKRMGKDDHVLVRRLAACETMGSVTTVCTDMAGLLKLNQMKVTEFWLGTNNNRVDAAGSSRIPGVVKGLLCQGLAGLITDATGSPMEKALLSWAVTVVGMDVDIFKRSFKVLRVEDLKGNKKCRGVLIKDTAGVVLAHWKGAADIILANCSAYVGADGATHEFGIHNRSSLDKVIKDMAMASLCSIAFAFKQVHNNDWSKSDKELTLLGIVGLNHPCRPEAKDAIEACRKAGVAVRMVTADNSITGAQSLAVECGIIWRNDDTHSFIEGHVFRAMLPEQQLAIVDRITVMAPSLPMDKMLLVQRLKQKGHVVAVAGDGIRDGPAHTEADVRLSMRTDFAERFIQFQLTANVAALVINFVSVVSSGNMPLTTVQLLWVNLIIDIMGALAIALDTPSKALMRRPPISQTEPLISNAMWRNLAAQAVFQVAVVLVLQHRGRDAFGTSQQVTNDTMIFNAFVLCQLFNEFNAREIERRNIFTGLLRDSRMFLLVVAGTLALQVVMVEVLTMFAGTKRLSWGQWRTCSSIALMSWPIGWAVKFIPVPERPFYEILARWEIVLASTRKRDD
ncbi:hypothetical protein PR202_gb24911 [Eleusine coracana subsp. coracana]|uniref:P-type Ca(2+) transporter n=1 Tax=Eleusine coracana subsp. coracana TaxID=191504 RepID=A0AAV5FNQ3_ELECO|nr:hypothetical protein PR202_gb24911 [Eleusine coracana subsp. coracana]